MVAPPPLPVASSLRLSMGNPLAVRTALLVASVTSLLMLLPFVFFLVPLGAGFATAVLYQRRSGLGLSLGDGAKLGWLTAIFNAIFLTVLTILVLSQKHLDFSSIRQQMAAQGFSGVQLQMLDSPWFALVTVLLAWILLFALSSLLHIAGGAMAARARRRAS